MKRRADPEADLDQEIASLEQRARNGRALADQCLWEARQCDAQAKELRRNRANERKRHP